MYEKQSYLSSKKAALQNGRLAHPSSPAFDNADLIGRRCQPKDCNASEGVKKLFLCASAQRIGGLVKPLGRGALDVMGNLRI